MPLGERVMVLEGLRMRAEPGRYARIIGGRGAGGKGLAYSSVDCETCVDVGEYTALASEMRRLAQRATTMQASEFRRAAQGDAEAKARAIDYAIAGKAAGALAVNADERANVARQLKTASPDVARVLIDTLKALTSRAATILKSDRDDWLPRAGGYSLLMNRFGARKKTLAGLGTIPGAEFSNEITITATPLATQATFTPASYTLTDHVLSASDRQIYDTVLRTGIGPQSPQGGPAAILAIFKGELPFRVTADQQFYYKENVGTLTAPNHTLSSEDQRLWDYGKRTGIGPQSPQGGPAAAMNIAYGALPFKVMGSPMTQQFYYDGRVGTLRVTNARLPGTLRVIPNVKTDLAQALEDIGATAEGVYDFGKGLVNTGVCLAAEEVAQRAMAAAGCGAPPFASTKCKLAAAAQAKLMRAAGCAPPSEYAAAEAAADEPEGGLFSGAAKIAIPALLAVVLLGGGK